MKTILLTLLFASVNLFAYSLVGAWSIDKAKTKASLKASALNNNERKFIERFILHTMKTMECTNTHTCLLPEQYKSNPTTGKYIWEYQGVDYLLKGEGDSKPLLVEHTSESNIKLTLENIDDKKLTIYFKKTNHNIVHTPQKPLAQKPLIKQSGTTVAKAHKTNQYVKVRKSKKEHIAKELVVDIDIQAEKAQAKKEADIAYLKAVQDVM